MEEQANEKLLTELREALEADGFCVSEDDARRILADLKNFAQLTLEIFQKRYAATK